MNKANLKPVVGFKGYFVNDLGQVFSAWNGSKNPSSEVLTEMKPVKKQGGYLKISMLGGGRKKDVSRTVHRLVLEAFVSVRPEGTECRHLNGNAGDNRLINLVWGTMEENNADRLCHGTLETRAKLNRQKVKLVRLLNHQFKWNRKQLVKLFNVHESTVSYILSNKIWKNV